MSIIKSKSIVKRFAVAEYFPSTSGRVTPTKPKSCPNSEHSNKCKVRIHCWKDRKTGPRMPLLQCVCLTHGIFFTIYPLGWRPRARYSATKESPSLFDSVFDAAEGQKWPKEANIKASYTVGTEKTQLRHINLWISLFGIDCEEIQGLRKAANFFQLPTIKLIEASNQIRAGPTSKGRAEIIRGILQHLDGNQSKKILHRGHEIKRWGKPTYTN